MTLEKEQEDAVRKQVIEKFGIECVKRMDMFYMELNDIRMESVSSYDFLEKVKAKYTNPDTDLVLAGLLYGMKMGEIGYEYHLKQMQDAKAEAEKIDLQKKADEIEEGLKKKKLEAEWEAADARRAREAAELFYQ